MSNTTRTTRTEFDYELNCNCDVSNINYVMNVNRKYQPLEKTKIKKQVRRQEKTRKDRKNN